MIDLTQENQAAGGNPMFDIEIRDPLRLQRVWGYVWRVESSAEVNENYNTCRRPARHSQAWAAEARQPPNIQRGFRHCIYLSRMTNVPCIANLALVSDLPNRSPVIVCGVYRNLVVGSKSSSAGCSNSLLACLDAVLLFLAVLSIVASIVSIFLSVASTIGGQSPFHGTSWSPLIP